MPLPTVSYIIFDITIPSTGQVVQARPFIVKEQKVLLQSLALQDKSSLSSVVSEIVRACLFDKVDVDHLKMFDIDYIFLALRTRSVSDLMPIQYICKAIDEKTGAVCGGKVNVALNLNEVSVKFPEDYKSELTVMINEVSGIQLKTPDFKKLKSLRSAAVTAPGPFNVSEEFMFGCVGCIFDEENVLTPVKDFTLVEFNEFIESLPSSMIESINNFFSKMPYVYLKTELVCPSCGNKETIELTDLESFFG